MKEKTRDFLDTAEEFAAIVQDLEDINNKLSELNEEKTERLRDLKQTYTKLSNSLEDLYYSVNE